MTHHTCVNRKYYYTNVDFSSLTKFMFGYEYLRERER